MALPNHRTHNEYKLHKEPNESHHNEANSCPDGNLVKLCSRLLVVRLSRNAC